MKKNKSSLVCLLMLMGALLIYVNGCRKNDEKSTPSLITAEVTGIMSNAASCGGTITDDGGASVTVRGVVWGTSQEPTKENNTGITTDGSGSGVFTSNLTGLTPNTIYHVRAYATNNEGTSYGTEHTFGTRSGITALSTNTVRNILLASATCGGNISDDGGETVTVRGLVWSTANYPSVEINVGKTTDGTGSGEWVSEITGLTHNTTYYVRAYATNSRGTYYGDEQTFRTLSGIALIATGIAGNVTLSTATFKSGITDDGGAPIIARGVLWDTDKSPTMEDNSGKTSDGTGIGSFTSIITGLSPNTTYYARTYSISTVGTTYGSNVVVRTMTGEVSDIDGNTYYTVTIGSQEWMAENLRVTKYNDGTDIPFKPGNDEWNIFTPAFCWVDNNPELYKDLFGATYNWFVCDPSSNGNRNVCPVGWHVPTRDEWAELRDLSGGSLLAGGVLKESGTAHWKSPNTGATNETGFNALPGGYRSGTGLWWFIGERGQWWSTTETFESEKERTAFSVWIYNYSSSFVFYQPLLARCGHSIRCLKD